MALALRSRIEALAWQLMPRVLERVFDAIAPDGPHLRIARLDLDLGTVRPDQLEEDTLSALEAVLSEALEQAILRARQDPSDEGRLVAPLDNRLDQFETWLTTGTVPFLSGAAPFDPGARTLELAERHPTALAALLRRRVRDPHVLERLVLQAGEDGLQAMLAMLTPAEAATILRLKAEIILAHRDEPLASLVRIAEPVLGRLLWNAALTFLLRDAGTQFNRRRFLAFLLEREAIGAGIDYGDLLRLLAEAVERVGVTRGLGSSLPRVLSDLLAELNDGPPSGPPVHGAGSSGNATGFADMVRAAADPQALMDIAASTDEAGRSGLLTALDRVNSTALTTELGALSQLHAAVPLLPLDQAGFGRLIWALAVTYLAGLGHGRFDRRALWRHLIGGLARDGGVPADALAANLRRGIRRVAPGRNAEAANSAYTLPDELAAEQLDRTPQKWADTELRRRIEHFLATGQAPAVGRALPGLADRDPAWLAAAIRRRARETPGAIQSLLERLLGWLLPEELLDCLAPGETNQALLWAGGLGEAELTAWLPKLAAVLRGETPTWPSVPDRARARLDRLALIAHWLDHGAAPWWLPPGTETTEALAGLPGMSLADLTWLFLAEVPEHTIDRLWRAIDALGAGPGQRLLERLAPWAMNAAGPLAPALAGLDDRRRQQVLLRAVAATLEGGKLDLTDLTAPVSAPSTLPQASPSSATDPDRLFAWLRGAAADARERQALVRHFIHLADSADPALIDYLRAHRALAGARATWAAILPHEALGRLVRILLPSAAGPLLDAAMLLGVAWRQIAPFGARRTESTQLWERILELASAPGSFNLVTAMEELVATLTNHEAEQADRLRARTQTLAGDGGNVSVLAALRRATGSSAPAARKAAAKRGDHNPAGRSKAESAPPPVESGHPVFIRNAGMVLLSPYLPTLFDRLGLLTTSENGAPRFQGEEATSRAVHLLQYLVDMRLDAPEPELVLNKLVCGIPVVQPVARSIAPAAADLALCDDMLRAVIANWTAIANTSLAGLRETFLQRDGRLQRGDAKWTLHVQRKTLDVLTDRVPWGFSLVYHRWMADPIHVTW